MKLHNTALIPARSGSKRIKGKNSRMLRGKPLVEWTINSAFESQVFERIILSTDDVHLIDQYKDDYRITLDCRDTSLCGDNIQMTDVICSVVDKYFLKGNLCLLQPTSPMRTSDDIKNSLELLQKPDTTSVVSVRIARHPVQWSFPQSDRLTSRVIDKLTKERSQDLEYYFELNGAIYWYSVKEFKKMKMQIIPNAAIYKMPFVRSIDIDDMEDFNLCEALLSWGDGHQV